MTTINHARLLLVITAVLLAVAGAPCGAHAERAEPPSEAVKDISFDTIKFDMKKGDPFNRTLLTPAINKLEGKRILIRGYILPSFQQKGISKFVLVRDNMECCFGPGAALFDCIVVDMLPGETTNFSVRPVAVKGKFSIKELVLGGRHLAIYHLDGEKVDEP